MPSSKHKQTGALFSREEIEFLADKIIEDEEVAAAEHLRDLIFRAVMPEAEGSPLKADYTLLNRLYHEAHPEADVVLANRIANRLIK